MRPLVQFQRPVETESGPDIAAFTVVRLERGAMAEGRIQMLAHRTEDTVWQPRWLTHPNGALGLIDLVVVSADVAEATGRFARFTGTSGEADDVRPGDRARPRPASRLMTDELRSPRCCRRLPCRGCRFMGAYAMRVASLRRGRRAAGRARCSIRAAPAAALVVPFPPELGIGAWLFVENAADLPWRS